MDRQEVINKLTEYINILKKYFKLKLVVFYGSYSLKMDTPDSDIDIAIFLEKDQIPDYYDTVIELFKLREKIDYRIEPNLFMYNEKGYENASFENYIVKNGIILYQN